MSASSFVQLGRYGDLLNILPALEAAAKNNGRPARLYVHQQYADLLEGVSYVETVSITDGTFGDLNPAIRMAAEFGAPMSVTQVYGQQFSAITREFSFNEDSWNRTGEAVRRPINFDRRNALRERALLREWSPGRRSFILVNTSGNSSPLHGTLLHEIRKMSGKLVIDLSLVKAHRLYDLLGLYDAADLLISADTSTLHLAAGSKVPVVALITDRPTIWHGSYVPKMINAKLIVRYQDIPLRMSEIEDVVNGVKYPRLVHAYADFVSPESAERVRLAARTWEREYCTGTWTAAPSSDAALPRNSTSIGDTRPRPFVKDLIPGDAPDDAIIVLTNTDTCFAPGLTKRIHEVFKRADAAFAFRWDFAELKNEKLLTEIESGFKYCGSDIFCFRAKWWRAHKDEFPDFVLGFEAWDKIMRAMILKYDGAELTFAIYHQRHGGTRDDKGNVIQHHWEMDKLSNPINLHCRKMARDWLLANNLPLEELA